MTGIKKMTGTKEMHNSSFTRNNTLCFPESLYISLTVFVTNDIENTIIICFLDIIQMHQSRVSSAGADSHEYTKLKINEALLGISYVHPEEINKKQS